MALRVSMFERGEVGGGAQVSRGGAETGDATNAVAGRGGCAGAEEAV